MTRQDTSMSLERRKVIALESIAESLEILTQDKAELSAIKPAKPDEPPRSAVEPMGPDDL